MMSKKERKKIDYEGEIEIVIGKGGRSIEEKDEIDKIEEIKM